MALITISGHPGSGTSTLVQLLSEAKGWSSLNGGELFRQEAKNRNLSLAEFGQLCKNNLDVDRELDQLLQNEMLAGWWAHKLGLDIPRVWLEVNEMERAKRVKAREGGSIEQIIEESNQRAKVDAQRFLELYDLLPEQNEPYSHIIDASSLNPQEVLARVLEIVEGEE